MNLPSLRQRWYIQHVFLTFLLGFATLFGSVSTPAHAAATSAIGMARTSTNGGYWIAAQDGAIYSFGDAAYKGGANTFAHPAPIVGIAATTTNGGYWLAAQDGAIYSFGDAAYKGGANTFAHPAPIIGIAATTSNGGYWLVASDGAIYGFGDAAYKGGANTFAHPAPIVGIAATTTNGGYWLVASDGAIYGFGDAAYKGGANTFPHPAPIVGIAATTSNGGYWLVASDGAIYGFGDAAYKGGANTVATHAPIVGLAARTDNGGYWEIANDGAVYSYGSASYFGGADLPVGAPPASTSSRTQLAQTILNTSHIDLLTFHVGGTDSASTAKQNIVDTANGQSAATSTYGHLKGKRIDLLVPMLEAMGKLANNKGYSFRVTEVAGGSHSTRRSLHYAGRAFDVDLINGNKVQLPRTVLVQSFMDACRAYGATEVLGPGNGGHDTHVHCGWK